MSSTTIVGTRPRHNFGGADFQLVTKQSVETWPKKGCVSTLCLEWYLIINQLRNPPWPRPAGIGVTLETFTGEVTPDSTGHHGDTHLDTVLLEEIIALVIHEDECREVLDTDFPDSLHSEVRILYALD